MKLNLINLKAKLKYWLSIESQSFGLTDLFDTNDMEAERISSFMSNNDSQMALYLLMNKYVFRNNEYEFFQIQEHLYDFEFIKKNKSFFRLLVNCICVVGIIEEKLNHSQNFHINNLSFSKLKSFLNDKDNREQRNRW